MTFNQLINWQKTSLLWQMMESLPKEKRNLQIMRTNGNSYPYVNVLWYGINKEFNERFSEIKCLRFYHLFTSEQLHGDDKHLMPAVYVSTFYNSCGTRDWNIQYTLYFGGQAYYESFVPRKNMELNNDSICKAAIEHAQKKYLFPEGRFRDFQQSQNATKEYTKKIYRNTIGYKPEAYDESDIDKWVLKHYNLDISAMDTIFAPDIAKKFGKQKTLKVVLPFPEDEIYDAMYGIDGDIDEHEAAYWSVIDCYDKNVLFY